MGGYKYQKQGGWPKITTTTTTTNILHCAYIALFL